MKFSNVVGFVNTDETAPGVWSPEVTERFYKGDILTNIRRFENGDKVNDDLTVSNQISIVADSYILENARYIRYVKWAKQLWKVTSIDINHPRIRLTLGGIYNGVDEGKSSTDNVPRNVGELPWY